MYWTAFTRPPPPTAASLSWKSWDTRWVGYRFTPASRAVRMSILLPEIPYQIKSIVKTLEQRNKAGKRFSILAVAEGALSLEESKLSQKGIQERPRLEMQYPSISYRLPQKSAR